MTGRIRDARAGIDAHIKSLQHIPGLHDEEKSAILDALSVLRTLENEEARIDEEERKGLAAEALRKIEPLSAKLRKK